VQAMAFVFFAMRGLLTRRGFDRATLCALAACAGLALITRVSVACGLYGALGLLLVVRLGRDALPPTIILLGFAGLAAGVNVGRWGDPLVFADFTRYAMNLDVTPDRLVRLADWGNFNLRRLPFGLSYYFLPLWAIIRPDHRLLFAEFQDQLMDAVELPPGSFLLTDPVLLLMAAIGIARLRRWPDAALLAGLALPPILMLSAISMAHRYRMEFYPCLLFAGLCGWRALPSLAATPARRAMLMGGVLLGAVSAHGEAALYAVSPWGPAGQYVGAGWIATYAPRLRAGHE
jgi:hypothetical protein